MSLAVVFFFIVALIHYASGQCTQEVLISSLGNTTHEEADGLVSTSLGADSGGDGTPISLRILEYQLVCLSASATRESYSGASIVVQYSLSSGMFNSISSIILYEILLCFFR